MSRPTNSAIHGYSIAEVFDAIEAHLKSVGFDFRGISFNPTFDVKNIADIETASGKLGKKRGLYYIHPNYNSETDEYWATVSYNTYAGNGISQSWSFAEHYLEHKDERLRTGAVKPKVMTPEERAKFAENQKKEQERKALAELNEKAKKDAAAIYVEFDHSRASEIRVFRNFKNHTNNYPYIKHKGLRHAYGLKFLPETPINQDDLKQFIERKYAEKYPDQSYREKIFNNILRLEKEYIHGQDGKEKSYNRRQFAILMIPIHNIKNEIKSAQLLNGYYQKGNELDEFGRKKLSSFKAQLSDGASGGCFSVINNTGLPEDQYFNKNKKIYILSEGWASAATACEVAENAYPKSHHQMQHIFGVNTKNLEKIAIDILEENPNASVLIAYDNDASNLVNKHGANAGLETGCRAFCSLGPFGTPEMQQRVRTISPVIMKHDVGITDWNDIVVAKGMAHAVEMFKTVMVEAADRKKNLINEYDFLVEKYDAQRQEFFNELPKDKQNEYRNPGDNSPLKTPYVIKFSQLIAEKIEENNLRNAPRNPPRVPIENQYKPTAQTQISKTEVVLPKDIPLDKSLGFKYDLNKPVNTVIEPNLPTSSLLANLMKNVDMSAVRNSGMNLVAGEMLTNSFVTIQPEDSKARLGTEPTLSKPEQINNLGGPQAITQAQTLVNKISNESNHIQNQSTALPVDQSAQPRAENLDHRKSELFTAFWLYQSELYRAQELISKADVMDKKDPVEARVRELSEADNEFLITDNTISLSFAVLATDNELRDKLLLDLKVIVDSNPEWQNIGRFTQYITDHIVVMDDNQRQNLMLQNKAVTKIISSLNSDEQFIPDTLNAITDVLRDTSNLAIDRIGRQSLYCEIVSALESSRHEPEWLKTAISSCEEYMAKSENRFQQEQITPSNTQMERRDPIADHTSSLTMQ